MVSIFALTRFMSPMFFFSGQKFAILEEKTVVSWIFRRYEVKTLEPFPKNVPIPELILRPSNGIRVKLTKR